MRFCYVFYLLLMSILLLLQVNTVQRTLVEAWGLIRESFIDPTFNHQGTVPKVFFSFVYLSLIFFKPPIKVDVLKSLSFLEKRYLIYRLCSLFCRFVWAFLSD